MASCPARSLLLRRNTTKTRGLEVGVAQLMNLRVLRGSPEALAVLYLGETKECFQSMSTIVRLALLGGLERREDETQLFSWTCCDATAGPDGERNCSYCEYIARKADAEHLEQLEQVATGGHGGDQHQVLLVKWVCCDMAATLYVLGLDSSHCHLCTAKLAKAGGLQDITPRTKAQLTAAAKSFDEAFHQLHGVASDDPSITIESWEAFASSNEYAAWKDTIPEDGVGWKCNCLSELPDDLRHTVPCLLHLLLSMVNMELQKTLVPFIVKEEAEGRQGVKRALESFESSCMPWTAKTVLKGYLDVTKETGARKLQMDQDGAAEKTCGERLAFP